MQSLFKYLLVLSVGFVFGYYLASDNNGDVFTQPQQTVLITTPPAESDVNQTNAAQQANHTLPGDKDEQKQAIAANQSREQPGPPPPTNAIAELPAFDEMWQPNQPLKLDTDWQAIVAAQYPKFYQPMMTYVPPQISAALKNLLQEQPDVDWATQTEQKLRDFIQLSPQAADMQLDFVRCLNTSCELLLLERTPPAVTVMFHQLMQQPWASSQTMSRSVVTDDKMNLVHLVLRQMPKSS